MFGIFGKSKKKPENLRTLDEFYADGYKKFENEIKELDEFIDDIQVGIDGGSVINVLCEEVKAAYRNVADGEHIYFNEMSMMHEVRPLFRDKIKELHKNSKSMRYPILSEIISVYAFRYRYYNPEAGLDQMPEKVSVALSFTGKFLDIISGNDNQYIIPNQIFSDVEVQIKKIHKVIKEKKRLLVKRDSYGFEDSSLWELEKEKLVYKLLNNVSAELRANAAIEPFTQIYSDVILNHMIDDVLSEDSSNIDDNDLINHDSHNDHESSYKAGIAFENQCRVLLENRGWITLDTAVTGDKGADLIAVLGELRVAIQCKNWKSNVGTSAVQEIETGKKMYDADVAMVVHNSGATKQAIEIADKLGVMILHVSELNNIEALLLNFLESRT